MLDWNAVYKSGKDFGLIPEVIVDQILSYAKKAPATFLDIGSGTGHLSRLLFERNYSGTGIDLSKEAVRIAASRNSKINYKQFDIENGNISELDGSYDIIVCKHTYNFIKDKETFLKRVDSLLNEKGIFAILTAVKGTATDEMEQKRLTVTPDELFSLTENKFKLIFHREVKSGTLAVFEKITSS